MEDNYALKEEQEGLVNWMTHINQSLLVEAVFEPTGAFASRLRRYSVMRAEIAVQALIYKSPSEDDPVEIIQFKELDGVWSAKGPRHWEGCYYAYEVSVCHPSTLRIEKCLSNDPYAIGCRDTQLFSTRF